MKLKEKLANLQNSLPLRSKHGQLHSNPTELNGSWKQVTLFTLFESTEDTHLLRPHAFRTEKPRDAAGWDSFFRENLATIQKRDIIPGMNLRTGKIWRVQKIIGWAPDVVSNSRRATPPKRRHQTKHKG